MAMDVKAENPERRTGAGSFDFLVEQISSLHKDLLAFEARTDRHFDQIDQRYDRIDGKLDTLDERLDHIDTNLQRLRTDMPKIVAETLREVLCEQKGKS